nr:unnamed protein product [Callosobruchus chinensis]
MAEVDIEHFIRKRELQQRADKFDKVYQEFEDIQGEIESTVVDSSDHLEYRAEFEHKFFAISAKAIALQENLAKAENISPANSIVSKRSSYNVSQEQSEVSLPVIKLPTFDGIHDKQRLSKIQNFDYLRASSEGIAKKVIGNLDFCAENCDIAWQALCDRFNNERLLEKAEDLETLEYKLHSAQLQDNNKSKLDYRQKHSKGFVATNSEDINKSESSDHLSSAIQCYFCKGDHSIYYCAQFLKLLISDRMQRVKKLKICINCLRGNHEMKVCRFGGRKICKAKHNTILHDTAEAEGQTKNVHLAKNSQIASEELIDPSTSETSSEQSICAFSVSSNAVSSTVLVIVCDKNNGQHVIRALLDCGSQSSFISTELANKLQLPKLKINLCVSGLNNSISYVQYKCNITVFSRRNQSLEEQLCELHYTEHFKIHPDGKYVVSIPLKGDFQKIIWRDDPDKELSIFQLNTVTYGTTAGSFLAIRSLYQLANEIESEHPCIANIIRKNMYVDDLLTDTTDVQQAKQLCRQIHDIFITRCFQLQAIQDFSHDSKPIKFSLNKEQEAKTLGLTWNSEIDCLSYKVTSSKCFSEKVTKRTILSKVASIFDPLGLSAPCIILAKILLHKLWTRWSKDYLNELQQRNRWNKSNGKLSIGQLVLIKEDRLPPKKWRLGRMLQLTPGKDNISRVATILTTDGELTRAVHPKAQAIIRLLESGLANSGTKAQYKVKGGRLYRITPKGDRLYVPVTAKFGVMRKYHDDIEHPATRRCLTVLSGTYWFPNMRRFVSKYIKSCMRCRFAKGQYG